MTKYKIAVLAYSPLDRKNVDRMILHEKNCLIYVV